MDVFDAALPGVQLIEPDVYTDDRGAFLETWNARDYGKKGLNVTFVYVVVSWVRVPSSRHVVCRLSG